MSSDSISPSSLAPANPIPLTVIGGFLGAGKTTLVNSVLAQRDERRLAVLVNDFGALSIDAALVSARSARTISLANGCVCCTLVSGLAQALIDVLRLDPPPDHVLVEASGVSDPRRIAQVARAERSYSEDATVVLAAADQIEALAGDRYVGDTVLRQLASADLVVLSKRDLVTEDHAQRALGWLRAAAPGCRIVEPVNGEIPCDLLLGPATHAVEHQPNPGGSADRVLGGEDDHDRRFAARTLRSQEPVSERALRRALDALPDAVLRAKGLVRLDTAPKSLRLVQAVGRRWCVSPAPADPAREESVLVMVGATSALATADLSALIDAFSQAGRSC